MTRRPGQPTPRHERAEARASEQVPSVPQEQVGAPGDTPPQGAPASSTDAASAERDSRLAEAEAKRDEYLADLKRVAAEYENYRKRAAREQERLVAFAHERLVRELLPVLDDLERTLEAAGSNDDTVALVEGVRLVERSLRSALQKEGLHEIETDGPFDPHVHEAMLTRPDEAAETGAVVEVLQRGYRLGDRVVRPARVIVAE